MTSSYPNQCSYILKKDYADYVPVAMPTSWPPTPDAAEYL